MQGMEGWIQDRVWCSMSSSFLENMESIGWKSDVEGLAIEKVFVGQGHSALEVVLATAPNRPTQHQLHTLWRKRKGNRRAPVLAVVLHGQKASLCGHSIEPLAFHYDLGVTQVERLCRAALQRASRHVADRFLRETLIQLDEHLIGIRNQGLVSTHELINGVPRRTDWDEAHKKALSLSLKGERGLLKSLGYTIERLEGPSYLLKDNEQETAIAIFLEEEEAYHHKQDRFGRQTPITYALSVADRKSVDFVIGLSGNALRLYSADPNTGFGSRGRSDTFIEINLDIISEDKAGYLWLIYSAEALRKGGTLNQIMKDSKNYAAELGNRLRERVYDEVVPTLAKGIANALDVKNPTRNDLDHVYRMTLIVLFRILLIAYTEDERFLPIDNPRYWTHSLKQKAHELGKVIDEGIEFDKHSKDHWNYAVTLFQSINKGNREWLLPAYNGRLFSSDPEISLEGASLAKIELTNNCFGLVLTHLLIDRTVDEWMGPVDFRNLGVREIGEIYEGLLESELSVAHQDLRFYEENGREIYVPSDDKESADVKQGEVYLHGTSGERKSTGTYYTKTIFIEHLLDYSLDPALQNHLARLDDLNDNEAADAFFDFRVADIAMGSGHFLISAIDRIEKAFSSYLANRTLPPIIGQINRMEQKSIQSYPSGEDAPDIETGQLLRRQIARRCIYGVDINPLAVELARLSVWIHTFVPGLPLTFLDHNLVCGDSLSGIGTLQETSELLDPDPNSLAYYFDERLDSKTIIEKVSKLGRMADLDAEEIREARETRRELDEELKDMRALLDILSANRIDNEIEIPSTELKNILQKKSYMQAKATLDFTTPVHFPVVFPEVFQGANPGFHVIIGNPPWEEETIEWDGFWTRYAPGLQALGQKERKEIISRLEEERSDLVELYEREREEKEKRRAILTNGPYPGMDTGDPDLYKAFCWRYLALCREGGSVGVVLPRMVFIAKGSTAFRGSLFENTVISNITFLLNNRQWVFNTHPQYTIVLLTFKKKMPAENPIIPIRGPFSDEEKFHDGVEREPVELSLTKIKSLSETSALPLLPDDSRAISIYRKMSEFPALSLDTLGKWQIRPHRELDATNDKTLSDGTQLMHFNLDDPPSDYWPIWKGETFDIWEIARTRVRIC